MIIVIIEQVKLSQSVESTAVIRDILLQCFNTMIFYYYAVRCFLSHVIYFFFFTYRYFFCRINNFVSYLLKALVTHI